MRVRARARRQLDKELDKAAHVPLEARSVIIESIAERIHCRTSCIGKRYSVLRIPSMRFGTAASGAGGSVVWTMGDLTGSGAARSRGWRS